MTVQEAGELLSGCEYEGEDSEELGYSDRGWWKDGIQIAVGYFSQGRARVIFLDNDAIFTGAEARRLKDRGERMRFGLRAATCGPTWPE